MCVFLSNGTCVCVDIEHGVNTLAANVLKTLVGSDDLRLPPIAMEVFALWMVSPELGNNNHHFLPLACFDSMVINRSFLLAEVQLKPHHKPVKLHEEWPQLVRKYTKYDGSSALAEPTMHLRRSVFFHRNDEMRIRDPAIIELLYCECKHNVLIGRYPCELSETYLLGSLVARINLGNFIPQQHTPMFFRYTVGYFQINCCVSKSIFLNYVFSCRNRLRDYLPAYACIKSSPWSLGWPLSKLQRPDKTAPESLIVDQLKKV